MNNFIEGLLVPMVEFYEFKRYIKEPFGNVTFTIKMSINGHSYLLKCFHGNEMRGMAEILAWRNEHLRKNYLMLHSVNISGSKEAFESLFRDIIGKMIGEVTINGVFTKLKKQVIKL